ncbi:gastrula zinc finger protein XlCGF7.1-like [Periplaneta americana]|uniref:gastrula zinc finger protein XlCGF7.1-like n=1 Tax=Periplaneta americana TaxID=6978 RepID=UPI0037E8CC61
MDVIKLERDVNIETIYSSHLVEVKHEEKVIAEPFPVIKYEREVDLQLDVEERFPSLRDNPVSQIKPEEIVVPVTLPDTEEDTWDIPTAEYDLKNEVTMEDPNMLQSSFHAVACDGAGSTEYENHFIRRSNVFVRRRKVLKEKPFLCDICGSGFAYRKTLVSHMRVHTGEKTYKCNVCGNAFARRGDLHMHGRSHTGEKPFRCTVCGKEFAHRGNLVTHDRSHTGEKPYTCNVCGKGFGHRGHLVTHGRIHTGEKPYTCALCGKCFAQRGQLDRHIRYHTGEKPYSCNTCGKAFAQRGHLVRHARGHTDK